MLLDKDLKCLISLIRTIEWTYSMDGVQMCGCVCVRGLHFVALVTYCGCKLPVSARLFQTIPVRCPELWLQSRRWTWMTMHPNWTGSTRQPCVTHRPSVRSVYVNVCVVCTKSSVPKREQNSECKKRFLISPFRLFCWNWLLCVWQWDNPSGNGCRLLGHFHCRKVTQKKLWHIAIVSGSAFVSTLLHPPGGETLFEFWHCSCGDAELKSQVLSRVVGKGEDCHFSEGHKRNDCRSCSFWYKSSKPTGLIVTKFVAHIWCLSNFSLHATISSSCGSPADVTTDGPMFVYLLRLSEGGDRSNALQG